MPSLSRVRSLPAREQAVVAMAVLLDGYEALEYLGFDREQAVVLVRAARDLLGVPLELRIPLVGTLLRTALEDIERQALRQ